MKKVETIYIYSSKLKSKATDKLGFWIPRYNLRHEQILFLPILSDFPPIFYLFFEAHTLLVYSPWHFQNPQSQFYDPSLLVFKILSSNSTFNSMQMEFIPAAVRLLQLPPHHRQILSSSLRQQGKQWQIEKQGKF